MRRSPRTTSRRPGRARSPRTRSPGALRPRAHGLDFTLPGRPQRRRQRLTSDRCHAGQQVLVGVHDEGRVGVTEAFTDDLDRDAGHGQERGVGVAEVVVTPMSG